MCVTAIRRMYYYYDIGTFLYVCIEHTTRKVKCIYYKTIYNTIMYYCMLTVTLFDVINFFFAYRTILYVYLCVAIF